MTDKELLELAAKAAGIEFNEKRGLTGSVALYCGPTVGWWNPLTDDGDALRLAVKLNLLNKYSFFDVLEEENYICLGDYYAATRRAIVRAAAEIGKEMK